jgi:hypothetical protein
MIGFPSGAEPFFGFKVNYVFTLPSLSLTVGQRNKPSRKNKLKTLKEMKTNIQSQQKKTNNQIKTSILLTHTHVNAHTQTPLSP